MFKYSFSHILLAGRSRWVEYAEQFNLDYDGSMVPPEWQVSFYAVNAFCVVKNIATCLGTVGCRTKRTRRR